MATKSFDVDLSVEPKKLSAAEAVLLATSGGTPPCALSMGDLLKDCFASRLDLSAGAFSPRGCDSDAQVAQLLEEAFGKCKGTAPSLGESGARPFAVYDSLFDPSRDTLEVKLFIASSLAKLLGEGLAFESYAVFGTYDAGEHGLEPDRFERGTGLGPARPRPRVVQPDGPFAPMADGSEMFSAGATHQPSGDYIWASRLYYRAQGTAKAEAVLGKKSPKGVTAVLEHGGSTFVGCSAGLMRLVEGSLVKQYKKSEGLPANAVRSLAVASDGRLAVGTAGGLALMNADESFECFASELAHKKVDFIGVYGDTLWISGDYTTITRRNPDGSFDKFKKGSGVPFVSSFAVLGDGTLVATGVTSRDKAVKLGLQSNTVEPFTALEALNGDIHLMRCIGEDLFVAGNSVVARFVGESLKDAIVISDGSRPVAIGDDRRVVVCHRQHGLHQLAPSVWD